MPYWPKQSRASLIGRSASITTTVSVMMRVTGSSRLIDYALLFFVPRILRNGASK